VSAEALAMLGTMAAVLLLTVGIWRSFRIVSSGAYQGAWLLLAESLSGSVREFLC
jgi:hypothetical protein